MELLIQILGHLIQEEQSTLLQDYQSSLRCYKHSCEAEVHYDASTWAKLKAKLEDDDGLREAY